MNGKQFTKDYQPSPERKKGIRWKTRLKHLLMENYDEISKAIIDKCKEGDIKHIEFLRNWLYGKPKETIDQTNTSKLDDENINELKEIFKDAIKEVDSK